MSDLNESEPVPGSHRHGTDPDHGASAVARFTEALAGTERDQDHFPDELCRAVTQVLDVDGAALSVYLGADIAIPIGASDQSATVGEALQFTVREGPCFQSYAQQRPVLVSDISDPDSSAWTRWPTYAAQLLQHTTYHGVFAYPLLADGIAMGSLSLYRHAGAQPDDLIDAETIAARVADQLLAAEIITDPDGEPVHRWMDNPTGQRRRLVWQAQGLTVQTNLITPGQAIDLLRAHAFTANRLLDDIAADIVAGRLPVPTIAPEP
jgi:hypothetical protein